MIISIANPEERTEIPRTGSYIYSREKGNPQDLIDNRAAIRQISFCDRQHDLGDFLYVAFRAPADTRAQYNNLSDDHIHFPGGQGWMQNDGNGHSVEYAGPFRLISINEGERFMDRQLGMVIGEPGDFILANPETGQKKLLAQATITEWDYEPYVCDRKGNLQAPLRMQSYPKAAPQSTPPI